jgi:hypothetical protein
LIEGIDAHGNLVALSNDDLVDRYFGEPMELGQLPDRFALLKSGKNLAVSHRLPLNIHMGVSRFVGQSVAQGSVSSIIFTMANVLIALLMRAKLYRLYCRIMTHCRSSFFIPFSALGPARPAG